MHQAKAVGRLARILSWTMLITASRAAWGSEGTVEDLKTYVEGIYTLSEWHVGDEVIHPPVADGRFVIQDGVVITVYKNWAQPTSKVSVVRLGKYTLDPSTFSYGYQDNTVVTEEGNEVKVSHKALFEGMRSFVVSRDANGVHFRRAEENIEFYFSRGTLTFSEKGKVLRVWRRVKPH